jgi:hypothetical protein
MTDDEIIGIAATYSEWDTGSLVSFYPSNLLKFAHAIEAARATAEQRDTAPIDEELRALQVLAEDSWIMGSSGHRRETLKNIHERLSTLIQKHGNL